MVPGPIFYLILKAQYQCFQMRYCLFMDSLDKVLKTVKMFSWKPTGWWYMSTSVYWNDFWRVWGAILSIYSSFPEAYHIIDVFARTVSSKFPNVPCPQAGWTLAGTETTKRARVGMVEFFKKSYVIFSCMERQFDIYRKSLTLNLALRKKAIFYLFAAR